MSYKIIVVIVKKCSCTGVPLMALEKRRPFPHYFTKPILKISAQKWLIFDDGLRAIKYRVLDLFN